MIKLGSVDPILGNNSLRTNKIDRKEKVNCSLFQFSLENFTKKKKVSNYLKRGFFFLLIFEKLTSY